MISNVLAVLLLLAAGWCLCGALFASMRGLRSRSWPSTHGVVRTVRVLKKLNSEGEEVSRSEIEYSYSVHSHSYVGRRVRFGIPSRVSWSPVSSSQQFRPGAGVTVHYSPSRPSLSTLQPGLSPFVLSYLLAGAALLYAALQLLGLPAR